MAGRPEPRVLTNLTFDLTTNPANVQVDGGGPLAPGDDVEVEAIAGSVNCEPVAVNVEAQPADNNNQEGDVSQHWSGQIGTLALDGSTMTVNVADSSDGAQAWLAAQNPACVPSQLVFDLKSAPANIQVEGGGPLAPGDQVEIQATAGAVNCVPVADEVHASASGGGDGGGGGWGGMGGAFGMVLSVNSSTTAGTCGTAGATGLFVVSPPWSSSTTTTINVDSSTTKFGVPGTSFASVCVGGTAGGVGTGSGGSLSATWVFVAPAGWGGLHQSRNPLGS